ANARACSHRPTGLERLAHTLRGNAMPTTPDAPATLDLHDPSLPARLHHAFDRLREDEPVHALGDGRWLLTRYDDVAAILKDRVHCGTDIHAVRGYDETRPFGAGSELEQTQEGLLINLPDAEHKRVRAAFTKPFTRAS